MLGDEWRGMEGLVRELVLVVLLMKKELIVDRWWTKAGYRCRGGEDSAGTVSASQMDRSERIGLLCTKHGAV